MVDESGKVSVPSGINDVIVVDSEEVATADPCCLVPEETQHRVQLHDSKYQMCDLQFNSILI